MGAELIGWQDRKPRGQNGKGPIKRGLGMALHQWGGGGAQDKQVTCTINPDGSVEVKTRHPGHRHRRPDHPRDHRRRAARPERRRHPVEHRQLDLPPRPGLGRLDDHPLDEPAVLRRGQPGPRRALRQDRPRAEGQARGALAQGRQGPGQRRGEDGLEGRLPQARDDADLRDRQVREGPLVRRRRRLPVRRRDGRRRDRRRPGQEDRRRPGYRPDPRPAHLGQPGLRRRHHGPELRPVRGADHGPDDGRDAQPRHGDVQARRPVRHPRDRRQGLRPPRPEGPRRHRRGRAAHDRDRRRHRQRRDQRHRRPRAATGR